MVEGFDFGLMLTIPQAAILSRPFALHSKLAAQMAIPSARLTNPVTLAMIPATLIQIPPARVTIPPTLITIPVARFAIPVALIMIPVPRFHASATRNPKSVPFVPLRASGACLRANSRPNSVDSRRENLARLAPRTTLPTKRHAWPKRGLRDLLFQRKGGWERVNGQNGGSCLHAAALPQRDCVLQPKVAKPPRRRPWDCGKWAVSLKALQMTDPVGRDPQRVRRSHEP